MASTGMPHMINAAADRSLIPAVDQIECQRGVDRNGRVKAVRWLPRPIPDGGDELPGGSRGMEWHGAAVARHEMTRARHPGHLAWQAFDRRVDIPSRPAGAGFFAEDVPRFERLPQLEMNAPARDGPIQRKTELQMGCKPLGLDRVAGLTEIREHVVKIFSDE